MAVITRAHLEQKFGVKTVYRVFTDDEAINGCLESTNSWILEKVGPALLARVREAGAENMAALVRIGKDYAYAYGAEHKPEIIRSKAGDIYKRCNDDIEQIRLGFTNAVAASSELDRQTNSVPAVESDESRGFDSW